jgi:hypothetical protein
MGLCELRHHTQSSGIPELEGAQPRKQVGLQSILETRDTASREMSSVPGGGGWSGTNRNRNCMKKER